MGNQLLRSQPNDFYSIWSIGLKGLKGHLAAALLATEAHSKTFDERFGAIQQQYYILAFLKRMECHYS